MFRANNFDKLLDKATSNLRLDPDWPSILQICDLIRQNDCSPKYAVAAVKKKLYSQNPYQAMFALLTLESIVKNCGSGVHDEVASKAFCEMLRDLVKTTQHENLKTKILELIQAWAFAFRNSPKYRAVQDTVNILKAEGHKFPPQKESDAMFSADTAPEWADGEVCHRCRVAFSLMVRRHHCRACGQVFCQQCSSKTSTLPKFGIEKEVRVCEACYDKVSRPPSSTAKLEIVDTSSDYGPAQPQYFIEFTMSKNFITRYRGEIYNTPTGKLYIKDEPISPTEEDFGVHYNLDYPIEDNYAMKKSLSMNDIASLREDFLKLEVTSNQDDMYSRYKKHCETQMLSKTKFVSVAEAIYHYQRDTPDRFHSSRPRIFRPQRNTGHTGLTVPQSPMLRCKARSRPQHVLSQKEKEEMELQEIKKFKIKANPIPKSVIEGPKHLPEVSKKPITVPEPFNLTEIQKKVAQSSDHVQNFKARPAPKHILEKPHIPTKPPSSLTKPVSPKFHYKRANSADHIKNDIKISNPPVNAKKAEKCEKTVQRLGPVKPEPFSFEKRDEELKRKREERIKQQMEEERRLATQFKAQPLPAAVKKRMQNVHSSHPSDASSENKENQTHAKFEAKPPVVLYKEPFKPVLKPVQLKKPMPFDLTTTKRAAERELFEKQLKEKEEENERLRLQKEREKQEAEERAIAELRAKLVHHAKPVPALHPFIPGKSDAPITVPETPKFKRPGKSAEELQEEEELQLALALSQSEAEHKEKERKSRSYIAPEQTLHPTISPTPSSVSASPEHSTANSELSRYLDRNYWEQRLSRDPAAPTAPSSHATNETPDQDFTKPSTSKGQEDEAEDKEIDEFVESLKSQVEIFVNRMKSNSSRGRSIANDTSVQTLFMNITAMHSKLLKYIQQQDDKRVYLESLQDKISQVRDSRAALDTLRAEHAARLAQAAEAAERQRQMQMAAKLQAMRKKKHEYLQYQRQLALQRVQEQEREMQMRQEQQKHQYMMSANSGFYMPGVSMHQFQPGYPNQPMYASSQFHPQMMSQATTDGSMPLPGQPQMSQANIPVNVNQMPMSQSMPPMTNTFAMSTSGMGISQPGGQSAMNQSNVRPVISQQLPIQQQMMMQQMQQMRMPNQPGVHQMMQQNGHPPQNIQTQNQQSSQQIQKQNVPNQPPSSMMPPMAIGQANINQPNPSNPMFGMQMPNMRMSMMSANPPSNNQQVPVPGYPMHVQNPQNNQPTGTQMSNVPQMPLLGQQLPMPNQHIIQGQPIQVGQPQVQQMPHQPQMHQSQSLPQGGQSQGPQMPHQPQMTQSQTLPMQGHPSQTQPQQNMMMQHPGQPLQQGQQISQTNTQAMNQGQQIPNQMPANMPQMMQGAMQHSSQMQVPTMSNQGQQPVQQNMQGQTMKQPSFGNGPPNQQPVNNQQQAQTPLKSEHNNNTAELISFD
ncbi:Hepatocyte growth factor-regulated tyrosine kinase substrate [Danaus plexippus plexippus]|uniref:Hepatocyte growth factor-regulated tyrosine kinase substrate n=1 Tax=Danaus plexippus plexippus TaxID=278856 RepID=A0A212FIX0_DANPL|nr:Hepatocyte growth factor-regulated tyrosine kinase substrate [Danaus plexippus plexippus]